MQRQALAGLVWSKQYYDFDVAELARGDPAQPPPPQARKKGRNREWAHFNSGDIMSMPDTWEYPWFAAWDLAFHCVPFALIDPDFAKDQLSCSAANGSSIRTVRSRPTSGRSAM